MLCRNVENPALLFSKENKIHSHEEIEESKNVFIMGYVTFSLGCYMACSSVASLAVGYIYLSCSHLYSFASYDRPYALKIMPDVEGVTPANTDFPSSDV